MAAWRGSPGDTMVFMTRKSEALLDRLVRLAGSAELVEQALRDLSGNPKPPTLEELIRRIIEIRAGRGMPPVPADQEEVVAG